MTDSASRDYEPCPCYEPVGGVVLSGWTMLADHAARTCVLAVDGPEIAPWEELINHLRCELSGRDIVIHTRDARDGMVSWDTIVASTSSTVLADDPDFETLADASLEDLFGLHVQAERDAEAVTVIFGPGAALSCHDELWYFDQPKRYAEAAVGAGTGRNLGQREMSGGPTTRRLFYVDWPILDRHRDAIAAQVSLWIDAQDVHRPTALEAATLADTAAALVHRPFRTRPVFNTTVWGGHWGQRQLGMGTDQPNTAVGYELIAPESGVLIGSQAELAVEVPFQLLVSLHPTELLGESVHERFGTSFPIRFDYLDTVDGGNLSVHCHPQAQYMREVFGWPYTQHESYYVMLAGTGSHIYLGLREDVDVDVFQAGAVNGKTDSDGAWHFDLQLPSYFAGRRLDKGAAQVLVEAAVKDSAGHTESRGEPITVSQQPILITAIPEGGMLIPELENQIFIVTAYPDGRPAATQIKVRGESAETDAGGAAVIHVRAGHGVETIAIEARDKAGNEARQTVNLASRTGSDQILLRAERAVYRAGDRILLHVFSTRERGAAYLDVVKEGQTVLTRDVDLHNGEAELTLTATPDLAGTVDFHAYLIGRDAQPVADHRLAFVQPADELKIEAASDSASYKPGDDARIRFRVTNSRGEGVRAAIGLQVVDEAVFALAEKQPGFAKVFFYLEQEVMKPRYEIHSIGMPEVVTTGANRDLAGRALFAATEVVNTKNFDREFGRTLPDGRYWEYRTRYWKRFDEQANKLAEHFSSTYAQDPDAGTLPQLMAKLVAAHDPLVRDSWGNDLILEHPTWMQRDEFQLRSTASWQTNGGGGLGLALLLHVNRGTVLRNARPGGTIDLGMEHDRGPFNGLAEIAGTVVDASGAVVPGVFVTARSSTGKTMTTHADADGHFQFSTVLPGDYNLEIISLGFRAASRELALQARDRAVLSVKLEVRQITESVEVSTGGYGLGQDGSVAGGTVGGVIGGIVGAVPSGPHRPLPCGSRSAAASSSFATAPS